MSDIESTAPKPTDASALIGNLLSNPELLRNISAIIGGANEGASEQERPAAQPPTATPPIPNEAVADGISRVLSDPQMMAKLPEVMKMLAPMMQQGGSLGTSVPAVAMPEPKGERDRRGCRNDLLLALKPFLSPERCRAIDMLLGLSRLGDALQKMI